MRYAALLDENDDVANVVVCPADRDPVTHLAAMGLGGVWVDAGEGKPTAGRGMRFWQGGFYRHWFQIAGADTGPEGEESGFPVGAEMWHAGAAWRSRIGFNVNEPLMGAPTTWSRIDGRYVTPAGWEYQPGEDLTEDFVSWFRVTQATSFAPSVFPAAYVAIDGPGGEPLPPPAPSVQVWTAGVTYTKPAEGDLLVTGAPGTPGEGRQWALQVASETAGVGREPWQAYMWAVWSEVTP